MSQAHGIKDVRSSNWGIWASIAILAAAFLAYFFAPQLAGTALPVYVRPLVLAAGFVLAVVVFFASPTGKAFVAFAKESIREGKKVVWPTRREVLQMTGVVFVFVFVIAMFVWGVDSIIAALLKMLLK